MKKKYNKPSICLENQSTGEIYSNSNEYLTKIKKYLKDDKVKKELASYKVSINK